MRRNNANRKKILSCINNYVSRYGYAPSIRELCLMSGYKSTATVHRYIKQLEDDGLLSHKAAMPRTIVIKRSGGLTNE